MAEASSEASPTFVDTFSTSPGGGPSRQAQPKGDQPGPRTNSLRATTSRDTQAERENIDQAIEVKRRKSSFFAGKHLNSKFGSTRKRANTHGSQNDQEHPDPQHSSSPERRRDGANQKGAVVGNVVDPNETDEGREMEEEIQRLIKEAEEAQAAGNNEDIAILKDNRPYTPDLEDQFPPREYVWDVLFENQRGLYIFGKAHFSSIALLPFDPSPYTLPEEPLEAASSKFLISHRDGNDTVEAAEDRGKASKRKSIKTAYTPETFTVPTPAWEWLTPWMINMRTGTDEMGWRYNGIFKKHGWSSKASPGGWGGWVRRREWVRLRYVKPQIRQGDHKTDNENADAGKPVTNIDRPLSEVLGDKEEGGLWSIVKALEMVSLDREKMQMWERWLGELDGDTRPRLQAIIDDSDSLHTLKRQFTYRSTATRLKNLLLDRNFHIPEASTIGSNLGTPPSPPPASRGYDV